ncbi:MAG: hypothetical protein LKG27_05115 [Clostridiaceae bacterium]|nr:hypothetical protein [Clostridiaceae bacterium]
MGASIPQVKGMKPVEFKEGESDTYIFETEVETEDEPTDEEIAELKETISNLKTEIAAFKTQTTQKTEIKDLKSQIKDLNIQLAKFKDAAADKDELAKELKSIKENLRDKDFNEFVDKQIECGILTPANKDAVLTILKDLDNVKKFDESSNSIESFKTFISALPKQIEFQEIATKQKSTPNVDIEKYADADEKSVEIYKQATAIAEKENISFKDALLKIKEI